MTRKKINFTNILLKFSGVTALLLIWQVTTELKLIDTQFVPSLSATLMELHHLWMNGDLFTHIMVSLWRSVNGLLIACVIALPMGFMLGRSPKPFMESFNPLFRIFAQVNPFSLMPVFILFFGIGEAAKLAVVAWVCIWPIMFNTVTGVKTMDQELIKSARALNIAKFDLLKKVLIPAAAPSVFTGLRVGVEMSFFMLIAGEMIGAFAGLGWLMHNSAMNYQIPRIYASGICIIALGLFLNKFLKYLQKRLFFWKESRNIFSHGGWEKQNKKLGRVAVIIIAAVFLGIVLVGTIQVHKANVNGRSLENHNHLEMYSGAGAE